MKYTGDAILGVSFDVLTPKPLDNRTVISKLSELYTIPKNIAYEGMLVTNTDEHKVYLLIDIKNINNHNGWQCIVDKIITCSKLDYDTWKANTTDEYKPIDSDLSYILEDYLYYIYEDSIEDTNTFYVTLELYNTLMTLLNTKATNDDITKLVNRITELENQITLLQDKLNNKTTE